MELSVSSPDSPRAHGKLTLGDCEPEPCDADETLEALKLTRILEEAGINCCFCGVSALVYYGAERVRIEWELCIPTELMPKAESLLKTGRFAEAYLSGLPSPRPQPQSLTHTYPRFQRRGSDFQFVLTPSWDVHLTCEPCNIQRSQLGLPYPRLAVLVQSYLETTNRVSLCDVVDGANVPEDWGHANLDLEGTNDLQWAARMNDAILANRPGKSLLGLIPTSKISKRELWAKTIREKGDRRGWTRPSSIFATRFRLHGSPDPWLQHRSNC